MICILYAYIYQQATESYLSGPYNKRNATTFSEISQFFSDLHNLPVSQCVLSKRKVHRAYAHLPSVTIAISRALL